MSTYSTIDEMLADSVPRHVWVISYAISMGGDMWLAVFEDRFKHRTEVLATNCRYWRGPLEGGPWRLAQEVIKESADRWERQVRFFDLDGGFELICGNLQVARMSDATGIEFKDGSR